MSTPRVPDRNGGRLLPVRHLLLLAGIVLMAWSSARLAALARGEGDASLAATINAAARDYAPDFRTMSHDEIVQSNRVYWDMVLARADGLVRYQFGLVGLQALGGLLGLVAGVRYIQVGRPRQALSSEAKPARHERPVSFPPAAPEPALATAD